MRRLPLIALVMALAALAGASAVAPEPAAAVGCPLLDSQPGTGTAADPIQIASRDALTTLAAFESCYSSTHVFRQTADIDLSAAPWLPIASFAGTYDGGGHRITGLTVTGAIRAAGLFAVLSGATVRDLTIVAPAIDGSDYTRAGALAAGARASTIERVVVEGGSVTAYEYVGGVVGYACRSDLLRSASSAAIRGVQNVGGLVGRLTSRSDCDGLLDPVAAGTGPGAGSISDSSASGAVTSTADAGGLVGSLGAVSVERSFASGAVTTLHSAVGGLAGWARETTLTDVYATGAATAGWSLAGGLIGATADVVLTRAYATGRVTATSGAGGLVGDELETTNGVATPLVTRQAAATSFWDAATTGQATSYGGFATAKSTADLQALATYTAVGWPIARGFSTAAGTTWGICPTGNGGLPFLQNRYTASTQPCAGTPGAPRNVAMTAGDGTVAVSWAAPAADGGSPVTAYTATAQPQAGSAKAASSCTVSAAATTCTITGLTNDRAYRVALAASNLEGAGTAVERTVTPRAGLSVLSTRRSGLAVVTRVRVRGPGRLTQVGRASGGRAKGVTGTVCRASARPAKAGVVTLRCTLSARARRALARRALTVTVTTAFRSSSGAGWTVKGTVAFPRTARV